MKLSSKVMNTTKELAGLSWTEKTWKRAEVSLSPDLSFCKALLVKMVSRIGVYVLKKVSWHKYELNFKPEGTWPMSALYFANSWEREQTEIPSTLELKIPYLLLALQPLFQLAKPSGAKAISRPKHPFRSTSPFTAQAELSGTSRFRSTLCFLPLQKWKAHFLLSWKHFPKSFIVFLIVCSSTAAPTYFQPTSRQQQHPQYSAASPALCSPTRCQILLPWALCNLHPKMHFSPLNPLRRKEMCLWYQTRQFQKYCSSRVGPKMRIAMLERVLGISTEPFLMVMNVLVQKTTIIAGYQSCLFFHS